MPSSTEQSTPTVADGRCRVIIEGVSPQIEGGRYPIKRVIGEEVAVEADIFADGHDAIAAVVCYRFEDTSHPGTESPNYHEPNNRGTESPGYHQPDHRGTESPGYHEPDHRGAESPGSRGTSSPVIGASGWTEVPMAALGNDRWRASFPIQQLGRYRYTVVAWVDHFLSWARDFDKKVAAAQDMTIDLLIGAELGRLALKQAQPAAAAMLQAWIDDLAGTTGLNLPQRIERASDPVARALVQRHPDRRLSTRFARELVVWAEPVRARYGAWYELFPRSCGSDGKRHGTLRDVEAQLPRIAEMGFDVLYLPPIHPIGRSYRKGRNNSTVAGNDDPGSPWAIGSEEGGHKAVHPQLGTLQDFRRLVAKAREHEIEIALDIAFQCAPEHPYVREHPEWFKRRPDGSIQYAENPPKKYQDIYPFDFESAAWRELWTEAKSVFEFWIEQGITIYRVDNPHTKAFTFWEWCIDRLKRAHPELILLSEAFTRPKVKYNLAKLGFTQSYNYFPWRNSADELREYLTELTRTSVKEFFRPNLWPNTPDILPQSLQFGGLPAFKSRFILAATLGASYGIYGPAYELGVNEPMKAGGEEYLHSEKYELKAWDLNHPDSLQRLISRVNAIRRENPALHTNELLAFHPTSNPQLLAYSKRTPDRENIILTVVNVDPHHVQEGDTALNLKELGIAETDTFQVHDLLSGARYLWRGAENFVRLDPAQMPAAIFRLRRRVRSEQDFDYFM